MPLWQSPVWTQGFPLLPSLHVLTKDVAGKMQLSAFRQSAPELQVEPSARL